MVHDIEPEPENVQSREDFVVFTANLLEDFRENQDEWENASLERYLDALIGITSSLEGRFKNTNRVVPEQPSWSLLAEILDAARVYE